MWKNEERYLGKNMSASVWTKVGICMAMQKRAALAYLVVNHVRPIYLKWVNSKCFTEPYTPRNVCIGRHSLEEEDMRTRTQCTHEDSHKERDPHTERHQDQERNRETATEKPRKRYTHRDRDRCRGRQEEIETGEIYPYTHGNTVTC